MKGMSFSSEVKEELSKLNTLQKQELVKSELLGYLISINVTLIKGKIKFSTESQYNINRFHKLLDKQNIDYDIQFQGRTFAIEFPLEKVNSFIKIKEEILLKEYEIHNKEEEKLKAFVRGAYLGAGSLNNPNYTYHLEVILNNYENAIYVNQILQYFGIHAKLLERKKGYSVYLKDGEEISKFLAFIGASTSVLKYEEIRVLKETRNNINRIINCETANLNKTINAATEQTQAIEFLKDIGKFKELPDHLKEIADLRIENPDTSLMDLGKMLTKPIGKSGVNHRLKKILEIAENYKRGN